MTDDLHSLDVTIVQIKAKKGDWRLVTAKLSDKTQFTMCGDLGKVRPGDEISVLGAWQEGRGGEMKFVVKASMRPGQEEAWNFLRSLPLETHQKLAILAEWGSSTQRLWEKNPWDLRHIRGVAFADADMVAKDLPRDDSRRLVAGIDEALLLSERGYDSGNTWDQRDGVLAKAPLGSIALAKRGLDIALQEGDVVEFDEKYQREETAAWEENIAFEIKSRLTLPVLGLSSYPHGLGYLQGHALLNLTKSGASILTGGPGTGKTHTTRAMVDWASSQGLTCCLLAPTGKAAVRLSQLTHSPAQTIHSYVLYPEPADIFIVDEASMLDIRLASRLLSYIPPESRVVFVGDVEQLPPVDIGAVLRDLIRSVVVPTTRLDHIFRQPKTGPGSTVPHAAKAILRGDYLEVLHLGEESADFSICRSRGGADRIVAAIEALTTTEKPRRRRFERDEVQILVPQKSGDVGTFMLNSAIQARWNPEARDVMITKARVGIGDRVINTVNDWDRGLANGEIGEVIATNSSSSNECVTVRFPDKEVSFSKGRSKHLQLAYATTIHKSQGSEFPAVIVVVDEAHQNMLNRNLLYTAVTRAKEFCGIVGQREAIEIACFKRPQERRTTLAERMRNG